MKVSIPERRTAMRRSALVAGATMPGAVRFELVDRLEAVREEWAELAEHGRNIFATWEFATTWWEHFGPGRRLLTVACRDAGGELLAILPLYLWRRRPLRIMRFLGNGAGDILGPVSRPERSDDAARALRRLLDVAPWDWDVFVGENLPGEEDWRRKIGGHLIRREGNPILRAPDGFERFLEQRTSNFRRQLRRSERQLARRYDVRYRLSDASTLDADLDALFLLHQARFGAQSTFGGGRTAFHRAFAWRAHRSGWLRLWTLELDGRAAAAQYGFRYGGVESFYQLGRDPSFRRESLGTLLLSHAIRSAAADGVDEFAFLRGHEPYKYRFATDDRGLDSIFVSRGLAGAAALAGIRALRSSPTARKLLRAPLEM
jgi:CelD/BcsL family acetyltransferase involved in cellulose biosynthesis